MTAQQSNQFTVPRPTSSPAHNNSFGPFAIIGEIMTMPFPRPRDRNQIMEDPQYYELRNYTLDVLYHRFADDDTT